MLWLSQKVKITYNLERREYLLKQLPKYLNIHSKIIKSDLLLLKNNLEKYSNLEKKYEPQITTIKMILRDIAQILVEAVTKYNRLLKYMRIFGDGHFIYRGGHNCPSSKMIYGDDHNCHLLKRDSQRQSS